MSAPPEGTGTGGRVQIGEPIVVCGRTLIPVIAAKTQNIPSILTGTIRLQALIVVEKNSWYAPLLPEGMTPEEYMAATPGLQELVEWIRTGT